MKQPTLEQLMKGQDLNIEKFCQQMLETDNCPDDPISAIIYNAWKDNGGVDGELDLESMSVDLRYAISQLNKVLLNIPTL